MVTTKISALEAAKAKVAKLEQSIAAELKRELAALPGKYGFESVDAFIKAVKGAGGAKRGRPAGTKAGARKRRKRAVITDAMRAEVKKLSEAGKTGAEIAKTVGISLPSVHNVKKALGLVEKRKK